MCGRYALVTPLDDLVEVFDVPPVDFSLDARYNIAPTQQAPVVAADRRGRRMGLMRWGLVPHWANDISVGSRMINARAETLRNKPSFKEAVFARRCIVPADGFFEWVKVDGAKVPHWIHDPSGDPLAFAGLWERWTGGGDEPLHSFTIITVEPNETVRPLHDRMPAILPAAARAGWLDKTLRVENALDLLRPYEGELDAYPVTTLVNSPANDVPECIAPA